MCVMNIVHLVIDFCQVRLAMKAHKHAVDITGDTLHCECCHHTCTINVPTEGRASSWFDTDMIFSLLQLQLGEGYVYEAFAVLFLYLVKDYQTALGFCFYPATKFLAVDQRTGSRSTCLASQFVKLQICPQRLPVL